MSLSVLAHLQKSKNKDFGGAILQKTVCFEGIRYVLKKLDMGTLRPKIGLSIMYIVLSQVSDKKLARTVIQFPLSKFARICECLIHIDSL